MERICTRCLVIGLLVAAAVQAAALTVALDPLGRQALGALLAELGAALNASLSSSPVPPAQPLP